MPRPEKRKAITEIAQEFRQRQEQAQLKLEQEFLSRQQTTEHRRKDRLSERRSTLTPAQVTAISSPSSDLERYMAAHRPHLLHTPGILPTNKS